MIVKWIQKYWAAAVLGWLSVISVRKMAARHTDKWARTRTFDEMKVRNLIVLNGHKCIGYTHTHTHTHTHTQLC